MNRKLELKPVFVFNTWKFPENNKRWHLIVIVNIYFSNFLLLLIIVDLFDKFPRLKAQKGQNYTYHWCVHGKQCAPFVQFSIDRPQSHFVNLRFGVLMAFNFHAIKMKAILMTHQLARSKTFSIIYFCGVEVHFEKKKKKNKKQIKKNQFIANHGRNETIFKWFVSKLKSNAIRWMVAFVGRRSM